MYRDLIDSNIRDSYLQLKSGSRILDISFDPINNLIVEIDKIYDPMSTEYNVRTTSQLLEPLRAFWLSEQVQELYKRRCEFELMDSFK